MNCRVINGIIFGLSLVSLMISMKLFYNMGVYVDEANSSLDVVLGGEFWLWMDWIRLAFIAVICLLSFVKLIRR
ncbi:MAG: hypothetical protein Q3980_12250 [Turicibacter sp.]|nr:hypothetical protein [Turicibacter sp.]MDO5793260.1 hypothetical protein [Turicibacter sp.]